MANAQAMFDVLDRWVEGDQLAKSQHCGILYLASAHITNACDGNSAIHCLLAICYVSGGGGGGEMVYITMNHLRSAHSRVCVCVCVCVCDDLAS